MLLWSRQERRSRSGASATIAGGRTPVHRPELGALVVVGFLSISCFELLRQGVLSLTRGESGIAATPVDLAFVLSTLVINAFVVALLKMIARRIDGFENRHALSAQCCFNRDAVVHPKSHGRSQIDSDTARPMRHTARK